MTLPEAPADSVSCLLCAGADLLAASAWDGTVRVWDPRSGAAAARHAATYTHAKPAMSVALAPSGERVVSGGADRAVRAFDLSSGQLGLIGEHKDAVSCVAVSADMPQVVLSGSWDRTLVCWDLREGPASVQQVSLNEKVHDLDVRWPFALVGGASPGQALLFDVRKAKGALTSTVCKTSQHLAGHPPRCVALFPKGLYDKGDSSGFCVGAYEGRVGVHFGPTTAAAPATGSKEWGDDFTFKCHRTPAATGGGAVQVYAVNALAFNPRASEQLATAGADGEVMWGPQAADGRAQAARAAPRRRRGGRRAVDLVLVERRPPRVRLLRRLDRRRGAVPAPLHRRPLERRQGDRGAGGID